MRAESGFACPMLTSYAVAGVGLKADGVLSAQDRSHWGMLRPKSAKRKAVFACTLTPWPLKVAVDSGRVPTANRSNDRRPKARQANR
jgi:hypothetical protein